MSNTNFIRHNKADIYFLNLRGLSISKESELDTVLEKSANEIREEDHRENKLLILTDLREVKTELDFIKKMSDFVKKNQPYIKASAVLLSSNAQQVIINVVARASGRDIQAFQDMETAKDWLALRN